MAQRLGAEHNQLPLWVHKNLSWQLSRDGNLHGLGMSHTKTASPKPYFRAPWTVGDAVCGWQRKCWMDNSKEWTSLPIPELLTMASSRGLENLCWIILPVSWMTQLVSGLNWTDPITITFYLQFSFILLMIPWSLLVIAWMSSTFLFCDPSMTYIVSLVISSESTQLFCTQHPGTFWVCIRQKWIHSIWNCFSIIFSFAKCGPVSLFKFLITSNYLL